MINVGTSSYVQILDANPSTGWGKTIPPNILNSVATYFLSQITSDSDRCAVVATRNNIKSMREVSQHWLLHTISTPMHAFGLSRNNFLNLSTSDESYIFSHSLKEVIEKCPNRFDGRTSLYIKLIPNMTAPFFSVDELTTLMPEKAKKVVLGLDLEGVSFHVKSNQLRTLISNFPNLSFLNIQSCEVDYTSLTKLNHLEELIINSGHVAVSLQKLNTVSLSWNNLKILSLQYIPENIDCSFLKKIPSLEELDLSFSDFCQLEILASLPRLKKVNLTSLASSRLTEKELLEFKSSHSKIEVLIDSD